MLYQIYDFQKALLQPLTKWAKATAEAFVNRANPLSLVPGAERLAASYELLHRLGKDCKKPEFGIRSVKAHGKEFVIQEFTALANPFCNLVRFKRFSDEIEVISKMKQDPVILIVAPLSCHHLTLLRDTVRTMLQDHKAYITDWIDARMVQMTKVYLV